MIRHLLHVDFQHGRGFCAERRAAPVNAILADLAADAPLPCIPRPARI